MIYRKTRLGAQIEPGSRNFLLQYGGDKSKGNGIVAPSGSETAIQDEILIKAVEVMFRNKEGTFDIKVTKEELALLKNLDVVLDKVKLVVDKKVENFYFADDAGARFTMQMGRSALTNNDPYNLEGQDKILEEAYRKCVENGKLTKKEIALLGKIDEALPDAAITINPQTGDATIISNNGGYDIPFPKGGGKRGK